MPRRKVDDLLSDGKRRYTALSTLVKRSEDRVTWTAMVRAHLPEALRDQVSVANLRGSRMTVHVSNASSATRVRYLVPELIEKLRRLQAFAQVTEIRIRTRRAPSSSSVVNPSSSVSDSGDPEAESGQAERHRPGAWDRAARPSREPLMDLAAETDYGELAAAILRLARHAEPPTASQNDRPRRGSSDGKTPSSASTGEDAGSENDSD